MAALKSAAFLVLAILATANVVFGKLPSYIKACKVDENLESCVLSQQASVIARIRDGDPANKIESLNPFVVSSLKILDNGASRNVAMNVTFKNLKLWGLPDGRITSFRLDPKEKTIAWTLEDMKLVKIVSDYSVTGKILFLPLQGTGQAELSMRGLKVFFWLRYDELKRGGKKIMVIKRFETTHVLEKLSIRMDNLFNGDNVLEENINVVMNDNWEELNRQLGPPLVRAIGLACKPMIDRIVAGGGLEEMFIF
ncbi:Hypothetical protein NTJ_14742 [Nesidiocoris tenuis]|uniref:Uncharacterized protein n=1 Tax=Nesidiocoris tenuis TaxID=355587 RepID=A0ABN7BC24_9HEMI|nr:Hypothetical protein NTJ_14742 [Nesidiocoris tenuis]